MRCKDWNDLSASFAVMPLTLVALVVAATLPMPAAAQDRQDGHISEIRAGVFYHDAAIFVAPGEHDEHRVEKNGVDINFELLFRSPEFMNAIGSPRPHIGATINTAGATSQAYAGLTWTWALSDSLFFELAGGGAVHNGETDGPAPDPNLQFTAASGDKLMGCRVLFRGSVAFGVRFAEHHSIALALDHISNGYLCDPNPGLDTLGLRWGYRF